MKAESYLAISETKTDTATAFATLRFAGDRLDPREVSEILPASPWRSHQKGEQFFAGQHAGHLTGRTGLWMLSTDKIVDSSDLADHLRAIEQLLCPEPNDNRRLMLLRDLMGRTDARAHVAVFWRGAPGEQPPDIPGHFVKLASEIFAEIEADFQNDDG